MKVLWITNTPFGHHNTMLQIESSPMTSGSWLCAAYESSTHSENIELHIATVAEIISRLDQKFGGCHFHILPGGTMSRYDMHSARNISEWESLKSDIKPDLILLWGTESRFAYTAAKVFAGSRIVIFMQGVLKSISSHYMDGVPDAYRCTTLRDFVDAVSGRSAFAIYRKQIQYEAEILRLASGVIVENEWCEYQCKVENPRLKVYYNPLPIRNEFYNYTWGEKKVEPYTIFTNAGGSPIKGHHILFKAIAKVKEYYPMVKVYIPGLNYITTMNTVKRKSGYFKYLIDLYHRNDLQDNIIFTGNLTAEEMAAHITKCNVYVMPSMAENHSSSLIEAMIVGAPCISSLVGGTAGLITPNVNGILYNSLEDSTLAGSIMGLFGNFDRCKNLSTEVLKIRETRDREFGKSMTKIYEDRN